MDTSIASSVIHLALLSETDKVTIDELQVVAAALSKQVAMDVGPAWSLHATVNAFSNPASIPQNYWPVIVKDSIDQPGAAGFHSDNHNQPYALLQWSPDWSVTASHEVIEAIGDPFGNRLIGGVINGEPVRVLKELCDPPEAFSYLIDGVHVSDFLLPAFFGAERQGVHYTFLNKVKKPLSIARGGYLSYLTQDNHWHQLTWFGGLSPKVRDLGPESNRPAHQSLRSYIDEQTREFRSKKRK